MLVIVQTLIAMIAADRARLTIDQVLLAVKHWDGITTFTDRTGPTQIKGCTITDIHYATMCH